MPTSIGREDVRRLVAQGAQLVEVLPSDDYEDEHIAGALNIPDKELGERAPEELDPDHPVIVYCNDYQ
jgi:rhodanese-related sulfurtransferase